MSAIKDLLKIVRAIDRGTLPQGLDVGTYYGGAEAVAHNNQWGDREKAQRLIAWFESNYPGGEHKFYGYVLRGRSGRGAWDRWSYTAKGTGDYPREVRLTYYQPHKCEEFRAYFRQGLSDPDEVKTVEPSWLCTKCDKPMTITEARRRGLLPPLVRKRVKA